MRDGWLALRCHLLRERSGQLEYLRKPGQVATLPLHHPNGDIEKYMFNVGTKQRSANCMPRPEEFRPAIQELANLCTALGEPTLAMPHLGAGLDRQLCPWAKRIILEAFKGVDTDALIFQHPSEYPKNDST